MVVLQMIDIKMNDNVIFFWDGPFSQWAYSPFFYRGIEFTRENINGS